MKTFSEFLQWARASDDVIAVRRVYIDMAQGDLAAGVLLSQLVWWHTPSKHTNKTKLRVKKDGHFWVARRREDYWDDCRLGPRQFDRAAKILIEEGLIEKKVYKFNGEPTVHIRILQQPFMESLNINTHIAFEEALDAEDDFIDDEQELRRIAEDAGATPHDEHAGEGMREILEALDGNNESVNSINIEDPSSSSSLRKDSEEVSLGQDQDDKKCVLCQRRNRVAEDIDKRGRCGVCLLVDAWKHFIDKKTPAYKTHEDGRREYVGVENIATINSRMNRKLKDEAFRAGWVFSLKRASHMKYLVDEGWFNPIFFLGKRHGEDNWLRIINGVFDGVNRDYDAASGERLQRWLRQQQAQRARPASEVT